MKLSVIITKLQLAKKMYGNIDVCFSNDEEGNNIMNTAEVSLYEKEDGNKVVCLFPYNGVQMQGMVRSPSVLTSRHGSARITLKC